MAEPIMRGHLPAGLAAVAIGVGLAWARSDGAPQTRPLPETSLLWPTEGSLVYISRDLQSRGRTSSQGEVPREPAAGSIASTSPGPNTNYPGYPLFSGPSEANSGAYAQIGPCVQLKVLRLAKMVVVDPRNQGARYEVGDDWRTYTHKTYDECIQARKKRASQTRPAP